MLANLIKLIGPILPFGKGTTTDAAPAADGFATLLAAGVQSDAAVAMSGTDVPPIATLPAETMPAGDDVAPPAVAVAEDLPADQTAEAAVSLPSLSLPHAPAMTRRHMDVEISSEPALPVDEADAISAEQGEGGHVAQAAPPARMRRPAVAAKATPRADSAPPLASLPPAKASTAQAPETPVVAVLPKADVSDPDIPQPAMPVAAAAPTPVILGKQPVPSLSPVAIEAEPGPSNAPVDHSRAMHAPAMPVVWTTDALSPAILASISDIPAASDDEVQREPDAVASAVDIAFEVPSAPIVAPVPTALIAPPPARKGLAIAIEATVGTPAALRRKIEQAFTSVETPETSNVTAPSARGAAPSPTADKAPVPDPFRAVADPAAVAPEAAPSPAAPHPTLAIVPDTQTGAPVAIPVASVVASVPTRPASTSVSTEVVPAVAISPPILAPTEAVPAESISPPISASTEAASAEAMSPLISAPAEAVPAEAISLPISAPIEAAPAEAISPPVPVATSAARVEAASPPAAKTSKAVLAEPASTAAAPVEAIAPLRSAPIKAAPGQAISPPDSATTRVTPARAAPSSAVEPGKAATAGTSAAPTKAAPGPVSTPDIAETAPPRPARIKAPVAAARSGDAGPGTSEPVRRALSLLRVAEPGDDLRVVARRASPSGSAAPTAPIAEANAPTSQIATGTGQPTQAPMPANATTALAASAAPPAPAAALASRIVDIGVSGQWIDRLAQEIATVAVTDGTARFALYPQSLGAMQVEIRHSDAGAAIRMLVETEAALSALKEAQPQLKADASLATIRIADIHVERRALPAEAASTARDQSQQQSAQSGKDQAWTGSQNQTTANPGGQGQTAGQPYRKAPLIEAALNGPPGGQTDAEETVAVPRRSSARYA